MKLLILSDSHGYIYNLEEILKKERSADMIIHLGDGADDMMLMTEYTQGKLVYLCKGNCDSYVYGFTEKVILPIENTRIFACHGHEYGVKYGLYKLYYAAKQEEAGLCLYGHTHIPKCDAEEDMFIVNPGSVSGGNYAVAEITGDKITTVNKSLS